MERIFCDNNKPGDIDIKPFCDHIREYKLQYDRYIIFTDHTEIRVCQNVINAYVENANILLNPNLDLLEETLDYTLIIFCYSRLRNVNSKMLRLIKNHNTVVIDAGIMFIGKFIRAILSSEFNRDNIWNYNPMIDSENV